MGVVPFLAMDDIRYRQEGRQSSLRGALQVRDITLTGRRGATTGSRGAAMNQWAHCRARGAFFSKKDDIRYWLEDRQPGLSAAFTKL